MKSISNLIIVFIAVSIAQVAVSAERLAILNIESDGSVEDKHLDYLTETIRTVANKEAYSYDLMDKQSMATILRAMGTEMCDVEKGDCAVETGRILNAALIVTGKIINIVGEYKFTITLHSVQEARRLKSAQSSSKDLAGLEEVVRKSAQEIFEGLSSGKAVRATIIDTKTEAIGGKSQEEANKLNLPAILSIRSDIENTEVYINGKLEGSVPLDKTNLPPGTYAVRVQNPPHYDPAQADVEVQAGQKRTIKLNPVANFGTVDIQTTPKNADIMIDGIAIGSSPIENKRLKPGKYTLQASKDKFLTETYNLIVMKEQNHKVDLKLTPNFGDLVVNSEPDDAKVFLDGTLIGKTPLKLREVKAGSYNVKISKNDELFFPEQFAINLPRGETLNVNKKLNRKKGGLLIKSMPTDAQVYIDGVRVGTTPHQVGDMNTGEHVIEILLDGYIAYTSRAKVSHNQITEVKATLMEKDVYGLKTSLGHVGVWSGAALGIASGAMFLLGHSSSKKYKSTLQDYNSAISSENISRYREKAEEFNGSVKLYNALGYSFAGLGLAAIIFGIYEFASRPEIETQSSSRVEMSSNKVNFTILPSSDGMAPSVFVNLNVPLE